MRNQHVHVHVVNQATCAYLEFLFEGSQPLVLLDHILHNCAKKIPATDIVACIAMANIIRGYIVRAYIGNIVTACVVMACTVMAPKRFLQQNMHACMPACELRHDPKRCPCQIHAMIRVIALPGCPIAIQAAEILRRQQEDRRESLGSGGRGQGRGGGATSACERVGARACGGGQVAICTIQGQPI